MKKENPEFICGMEDVYPQNSTFIPKSEPWSSDELIGCLDFANTLLSKQEIVDLEPTFWNDLCSEYDADNLCKFLKSENIKLTEDFKAFEFVWRRDELNHYIGFRQIYRQLYGLDDMEISRRLNSREFDFSPITHLLSDEFNLCLLLAYDEIVTTKSYASDFELYSKFGHENYSEWIKRVTKDEGLHFVNCMELIRKNHPNRIAEIPKLVDKYIDWDLNGGEYKGTFILDHDGHYFTEDFLISCGKLIKRYFKLV